MTQLVFVHGVATRGGPKYDRAVLNRNMLFQTILFDHAALTIHTPLWGNLVPTINDTVYKTNAGAVAFALGAGAGGMGAGLGGGAAGQAEGPSLADVARANPTVALDALFAQLLAQYDAEGQAIPADQLNAFARATDAMAADERAALASTLAPEGTAALIGNVATDADLTRAVRATGGTAASLSIGSVIGDAVKAVTDRLRKIASSVVFDPLADLARLSIGFFLGDVFTYLHDGATRAAIRGKVLEALLAAHAARTPGEKLVVIGHSLGGVILADMLCSPGDAGLPADFHVDVLLTVGSQPGLFQALGLFLPVGNPKTPKPACVDTWYNVFDPIDPLAFRADPIFDDVTDFKFDSITGLASAHTTYFLRPQFYARARKRLQDCGVIP